MDNIVSLSSYKELKEALELHEKVHGLILDSMLRRQSLIDNRDPSDLASPLGVPELPKELQEFENCFDFNAVISHQFGAVSNRKAFDQFVAAVDRYYFQNPNSSAFEFQYLFNPDEDNDGDDEWMEKIFEETGHRLDLKAVFDHVTGNKRDDQAVKDFRWFMRRDAEELEWN